MKKYIYYNGKIYNGNYTGKLSNDNDIELFNKNGKSGIVLCNYKKDYFYESDFKEVLNGEYKEFDDPTDIIEVGDLIKFDNGGNCVPIRYDIIDRICDKNDPYDFHILSHINSIGKDLVLEIWKRLGNKFILIAHKDLSTPESRKNNVWIFD